MKKLLIITTTMLLSSNLFSAVSCGQSGFEQFPANSGICHAAAHCGVNATLVTFDGGSYGMSCGNASMSGAIFNAGGQSSRPYLQRKKQIKRKN